MAWNNAKPAASSFLNSAEIRSNWDALQASLMGVNWVGDPNFLIWSAETSNGASGQTAAPDHWSLSGTGATVQRCGTGLTDTTGADSHGWACKLSYGSATAFLSQPLLADTVPTFLSDNGMSLAFGVWVKGSGSSVARAYCYDDDTGYSYSSYNTSTDWEWLTGLHEIGDPTSSNLSFGVELASGSCYVMGATVLLGDIVPPHDLPAPVIYGAAALAMPGTVIAASYSTGPDGPGPGG